MPQQSYDPIEQGAENPGESHSNTSTPHLPTLDLGRQSLLGSSRASTPVLDRAVGVAPDTEGFSSAQAYAALNDDIMQSPSFWERQGSMSRTGSSRPFLGSEAGDSKRYSGASSLNMLNMDWGSQQHLMKYDGAGSIPMQNYDSKDGTGSKMYQDARYLPVGGEKNTLASKGGSGQLPTRKKWFIFGGVVAALIIIAIAVAVPLVVLHDNKHKAGKDGALVPGTGEDGKVLTSGGNGTVIRMENGTEFTYVNNFGGSWRSGLSDNSAQAQNYTPAMNESWNYVKDRIFGVNLGGWLVLEPFIVPSLFEAYENDSSKYVVDEYTLMQQWQQEGGEALAEKNMRNHYDTFITEYDFMMIAAAGLNWVRLPIGYWSVSTLPGEPFLQGVSWEYFLKAIQWARKYGLRIELDLHAVPGSQNGYNHGGRLGVFNFLNSPSGLVSAQRTLDIIRVITEFIAQPEISNVVPIFGILNEPNLPVGIGMDSIRRFYVEVYKSVRNVTGTGEDHGPMIAFHDGFMGLNSWTNFMQGGDRIAWDLHPYVCFVPPFGTREELVSSACNGFQANTDQGLQQFGVMMAGEWSLANNDCGLFLNGPFQGVRYDGTWSSGQYKKQGDCEPYDNWGNYSRQTKQTMKNGAIAQLQAFRNSFFWTWKIGNSLRTGGPVNPNWSYLLGLQEGWMPTDPYTESKGACAKLQAEDASITKTSLDWKSTFAGYQTGAASSYSAQSSTYSWPPVSIYSSGSATMLPASSLPTYTPTGKVIIPPTPTYSVSFTNEPTPSIDPWTVGGRQTPAYTAVAGCSYFDSVWQNASSIQPGWPCEGNSKRMLPYRMPLAADEDLFRRAPQIQPKPTPMAKRNKPMAVQ